MEDFVVEGERPLSEDEWESADKQGSNEPLPDGIYHVVIEKMVPKERHPDGKPSYVAVSLHCRVQGGEQDKRVGFWELPLGSADWMRRKRAAAYKQLKLGPKSDFLTYKWAQLLGLACEYEMKGEPWERNGKSGIQNSLWCPLRALPGEAGQAARKQAAPADNFDDI